MDLYIETRDRMLAKDRDIWLWCMNNKCVYLNIGCGDSVYAGAINIDKYVRRKDVLPADALYLPFKDNSVDFIYSAHSLEHLTIRDGKKALKAWYKALKPNGRLIIELPDLECICRNVLNSIYPKQLQWNIYTLFGYQIDPRNSDSLDAKADPGQFHMSGYTQTSLCLELAMLGFEIKEFLHTDGYGTPNMHVDAFKR
jgi:SAM-dependent methyltransferase